MGAVRGLAAAVCLLIAGCAASEPEAIVVPTAAATLIPTPTASPAPEPTPSPTPTEPPTPEPTLPATSVPTPEPTPVPRAVPTPSPVPTPEPTPTIDPSFTWLARIDPGASEADRRYVYASYVQSTGMSAGEEAIISLFIDDVCNGDYSRYVDDPAHGREYMPVLKAITYGALWKCPEVVAERIAPTFIER